MKTVFLTTSPKKHKRWANSTYFLWLTKLFFASKEVVWLDLSGKKDYEHILNEFKNADTIVMAMPVYVDAIPSHILSFLQEAENSSKQNNWHCKVYTVANCGFYEGIQCQFLLEQIKCWCQRSKLEYGGGLGIGAGEMLGVLRLTNVAYAALQFIIQLLIGAVCLFFTPTELNLFSHINWISIGINLAIFLLYSLGLYINTFRFAKALRQRKTVKNRYTTVWFCGRYIFMFFASLFWIIRAVFHAVSFKKMFYKAPRELW